MSGPIPPPPSIVTANGSRIIVTGTPALGQVVTADGPNAAHWAPAGGGGVKAITKLSVRAGLAPIPSALGHQQVRLMGAAAPFTVNRDPDNTGVLGPAVVQRDDGGYTNANGLQHDMAWAMVETGWYSMTVDYNLGFNSAIIPTSAVKLRISLYNGGFVAWAPVTAYDKPGYQDTITFPPFYELAYSDPLNAYWSMALNEWTWITPGAGDVQILNLTSLDNGAQAWCNIWLTKVG